MSKLRGLFDEQIPLGKISKHKDPLERLSSYIDFEYFRKKLQKYRGKEVDRSKGGRPGYDYVLISKILTLELY